VTVLSLSDDTTLAGAVTSAATRATVTYTGGGGSKINSGDATFTLTGQRGATVISVTHNESLSAVRDRINADSHDTGITAAVAGNNLIFTTVDYGSDASLLIDVTSGSFATAGSTAGTDAVVTINGQSIAADDVSGNRVWFRDQGVNVQIDFQAGFTGAFSSVAVADDSVARFNGKWGRRCRLGLDDLPGDPDRRRGPRAAGRGGRPRRRLCRYHRGLRRTAPRRAPVRNG
jgi:hypothetical protein